ncbi:MAG: 50S ribosomal protein L20 [Deltaproteobacteria bacterium CG11_big_fil_rev_8_21_14_0_20_47_16]|nr:MAG: 50S ribosomal protein L20 [Deltaproteobacteria bacterium CG11_big_fil_rev_8_21_14_0_20_47_16]
MARAKRGVKGRRRHKKVLKEARGYIGGRSKLYRTAQEAVDKALVYAYGDRKDKKRNFRTLWQVRISAAAKENGTSYSKFIAGLKKASIGLDRKVLANIAAKYPQDFAKIVQLVK